MTRDELLREIKSRLQAAHGDRLCGVVLYGSEARGDAEPDSDIDVLVLLKGPMDYLRDVKTNIRVLYSLVLEFGRPISPKVVDVLEYEAAEFPLYRNAQREGIVL